MDSRLIALAIPVFFLLIGAEAAVARARGLRRYRLHDTVASLGCGIGEQVIVVFAVGLTAAAYAFVARHLAVARIPTDSVIAWVALLFAVDHQFYWFHRASHRVGVLWAAHAVHHQSEEYNLSTALRQSWFESTMAAPFYFPLAVLGFPLAMFATASTANLLYQFWVHTRLIDRLGGAEGLLNTPSSHRVHHGIDPTYVDKNYGGMFMLWDRLYGTYREEASEPVYGTVKPLGSWNPLVANLDGWGRLWSMATSTSSPLDKLRVWVAPPDWRPRDLGGPVVVPEVDRATYRKFETDVPRAMDRYVIGQLVIVALVTSGIMWFASKLPVGLLATAVTWVLAALTGWGGLFDRKPWAILLEVARHGSGIALGIAGARWAGEPAVLWCGLAVSVGSLAWLAGARAFPARGTAGRHATPEVDLE